METCLRHNGKANRRQRLLLVAAVVAVLPGYLHGAGTDSERMARAKDLIADEQWRRAIVELRAAYADPAESARDEAAFWLAHSLFQSGDAGAALQAIAQLERRFPRSRWVFPARSLKVEIAHRLNRSDLLWSYADVPPPPPPPPAPRAAPAVRSTLPAPPAPVAPPAASPVPLPPAPPARDSRRQPNRQWVMARPAPEATERERDLQILALGGLVRVQPDRAEPILKRVALGAEDEEQARRAIFVLLQANRIDAVADLARQGSEGVTLAAVKELGFVRSSSSASLLRELYVSGSEPVKVQVLRSLGRARQTQSLMLLARRESDRSLREAAVSALGQAGARVQLASLYREEPDLKLPVIAALFTAGGEQELTSIARRERDAKVRDEAITRLKLLGTEVR